MNVSRHARVLVGVACALTTTATLAGADEVAGPPPPDPVVEGAIVVEQQVAVDPTVVVEPTFEAVLDQPQVDPYYDPYYYPDPYPQPVEEAVPSESIVVTASGMQAWLSRQAGLEVAARGGTVGFSWLERDGDFPTGVEVTGIFLVGDRMTSYALSSRLVGSAKIGARLLVPYAAVGLAVGASRVVENGAAASSTDKDPMSTASYGFAIGPSAEVGVHGFLGKKLYWRAGAGFVGAAVGAVTADLGVGFVVD